MMSNSNGSNSESATHLITVRNVTKLYVMGSEELYALKGISLGIEKNEYVAIMGPSGSGKSTLMNILGCLDTPTSGDYFLNGKNVSEMDDDELAEIRNREIGFVFQTFNLVPYLTAVENVQVPLYLAGISPNEQRQRAVALLERVGLSDRLEHKPHEMSTGQQQRVALARTMANQPPIILADEPTGNLDPESRARVLDFFDELHRQKHTIVMVTHDSTAAARAQRKLVLGDGGVSINSSNERANAA